MNEINLFSYSITITAIEETHLFLTSSKEMVHNDFFFTFEKYTISIHYLTDFNYSKTVYFSHHFKPKS